MEWGEIKYMINAFKDIQYLTLFLNVIIKCELYTDATYEFFALNNAILTCVTYNQVKLIFQKIQDLFSLYEGHNFHI